MDNLITSVWLDSGAFSSSTQRIQIDIDTYIKFILLFKDLVDVYFNLDVILDGRRSWENWVYMRKKGLNPVPVYHMGTSIEYLVRYLREAEGMIAIGAIANMSTPLRIYWLDKLWRKYLFNHRGKPKTHFHGFGLTAPELVTGYPWHSVDSTSWALYGGKFGVVCIPDRDGKGYIYHKPPMTISVGERSSSKGEVDSKHFDSLPPFEQQIVEDYFKGKGITVDGLKEDRYLRHEANMLYYLDLERAAGSRLYMAGNYDILGDTGWERHFQQKAYSYGSGYRRMISFFDYWDPKRKIDIRAVLELVKEERGI